jgi:GTP-binding nuclear protein Ran
MSYNIAILGDAAVGKTSFIRRLKENPIPKNYVPTIGVEVHPVGLETNRGHRVMHVWDFAGKKEFQTNASLPKFDLVLILYSLDRMSTFTSATSQWIEFANDRLDTTNIVFVANKSDLTPHKIETRDMKISCKEDPDSAKYIIQNILYKMTGDNELFLI